ncbi:hypothetical protein PMAYCL1PPCAC_00565, partial [Pristionchus mayeri]
MVEGDEVFEVLDSVVEDEFTREATRLALADVFDQFANHNVHDAGILSELGSEMLSEFGLCAGYIAMVLPVQKEGLIFIVDVLLGRTKFRVVQTHLHPSEHLAAQQFRFRIITFPDMLPFHHLDNNVVHTLIARRGSAHLGQKLYQINKISIVIEIFMTFSDFLKYFR